MRPRAPHVAARGGARDSPAPGHTADTAQRKAPPSPLRCPPCATRGTRWPVPSRGRATRTCRCPARRTRRWPPRCHCAPTRRAGRVPPTRRAGRATSLVLPWCEPAHGRRVGGRGAPSRKDYGFHGRHAPRPVAKLPHMTSEPIRDPVNDHLLTPQNAALVVIDYQPSQIQSVRSMDHDLLVDNIVSVARLAETFHLPLVLSTVKVAHGQGPTVPELKAVLSEHEEINRTQINSWEDLEFRRAVEASGRRKLIMTAL